MRERQVCIGCGRLSPETDTNYTLISSQFGWRLSRKPLPNGRFQVEWRCPDCWKAFKKAKAATDSQGALRTLPSSASQLKVAEGETDSYGSIPPQSFPPPPRAVAESSFPRREPRKR